MLPIAPDTLLQQRYRVLNMLGEGRFGRIYLAVDRGRADAYCAIEELAPFPQSSSAVVTAKAIFKQEATLLYQLQHPQIPRFWTTFEEQDRLLLVRDYIAGKTYQELLDDRRHVGRTFSQSEVYQFLLELLPVIGYIHSKGTIHRDISPAHIICRDNDLLPVPIDFGVVKEFANKLQAAPGVPRIAIGQPGYAPIEQLEHGQVYPNSDLYALAVTAIVLLTGKEPSALFKSDVLGGEHHHRMNWDWRKWTEIDDGFADILSRMLSPHPNDRYQSATAVDRDLQSLDIDYIPNDEKFQPDRLESDPLPLAAPAETAHKSPFSVANRVQAAVSNLSVRSVWEKPQVFIPVGILISLLAGVGSWFAVTQLLNKPAPVEPVAIVPPKQIDFNNPTIPTDTSSPSPTGDDTIQPEMDRSIEKEGKVDADTPVRYKITAIAGQNLDIQLVPLTAQGIDPNKTTLPIDSTPITTSPNPTQSKDRKPKQTPTPVATTAIPVATQVLMTIISPTGSPIDEKSDRVVGWRGQLTTSGDYTIELRPIKGLSGLFPYKLSVTQLSITPATAPTNISPNPAGSTPPLGIPIPIGGTGLESIPAQPDQTIPTQDLPTLTPVPIPNQGQSVDTSPTPRESARPTRKRRRNRTPEQSSPQIERERAKSSEEQTPPRRRRRAASSEETTPAPRRNRQPSAEPQPNPVSKPDLGENGGNTPPAEEQIQIIVPEAKKSVPPPARTNGSDTNPPNSGDIDSN